MTESRRFYLGFWEELLAELSLDDSSQPMPNPTGAGNIFFPMPPAAGTAWLTAYCSKATMQAGVFLRFKRGNYGDTAYDLLLAEREEIDSELEGAAEWTSIDGKHSVALKRAFDDLYADRNRADLKAFLLESINRMVNVFRPRLERIAEEVGGG